jgi:hypothetical protein
MMLSWPSGPLALTVGQCEWREMPATAVAPLTLLF